MTLETTTGHKLEGVMVAKYFRNLVNLFFKILPMREDSEPSLDTYMCNLRDELLGCKSLIVAVEYDPSYLSLISLLQHLIDAPDASVSHVRRCVFNAIAICNKLGARYSDDGR